jgi:hypothetical protein
MIEMDDDRLGEVLASVGDLLVIEHVAVGAVARPPARRRGRIAAMVAAAAAITVVSVAPLRGAVADWLGIGSTHIRISPTPPSTSSPTATIEAGVRLVPRATAESRLAIALDPLDTAPLGAPAAYGVIPEGGILVLWSSGATLWIHEGELDPDRLIEKLVTAASAVEPVDDLGDGALVVTGDHFLRTPRRVVAATSTVLWRSGVWEYRLEADQSPDSLIETARELARLVP